MGIIWTAEEKTEIAKLSFKIRSENLGSSDLDCVRQAMTTLLPVDKHRSLVQMNQVDFVRNAWRKLTRGEEVYIESKGAGRPVNTLRPQGTPEYEAFEKRLLEVAKEAGYKNPAVWASERAGLGTNTVYNFRTAKRIPGISVLQRIATASNKTTGWFLGEDKEEVMPVVKTTLQVNKQQKVAAAANYAPPNWPQAISPIAPPQHEAQLQKKPTLDDLTTEMLAQELVSRLLKAVDTSTLKVLIREEVNAVLERRLPGVLAPDEYVEPPSEEVEPQKKLVKVCVLGLLSKQQNLLKDEYRGLVDFHFLQGSEGAARLKKTAELMDLTIRSKWVKGMVGSMNGVPNFVHANGLDSVRNLIAGRFGIKQIGKD